MSFNQLNIIIGISAAFFSNYLILQWLESVAAWTQTLLFDTHTWRWMLGIETIHAILYLIGLYFVPQKPEGANPEGRIVRCLQHNGLAVG